MEKSLIHRHIGRRRAAVEAVDAGTATFQQWFEAQFGPAPTAEPIEDLRLQLHDAENRVAALRLRLEAASQYAGLRDAALKAWAAREDLIRRNLAAQAPR